MPRLQNPHTEAVGVILLDACCVINLYATGQMREIITDLPHTFAVAEEVVRESLFVRSAFDPEISDQIELDSFLSDHLLTVVSPETEAEITSFVDFATSGRLDDGEAMTCAIALHRGFAMATDDARTLKTLIGCAESARIYTTPQLLKDWTDIKERRPDKIRMLLRKIESRARFRPHKGHALSNWWQSLVGP